MNTIKIGELNWMTENLNISTFVDGEKILEAHSPEDWMNSISIGKPMYCSHPNDPNNENHYGKIYNWYAVNSPHSLAPEGYHIPSISEWKSLISQLGGYSVAGGKLKDKGYSHWREPNKASTNEIGFLAYACGYRDYYNGMFDGIGLDAFFWTSTQIDEKAAYSVYLNYNSSEALIHNEIKRMGFSVRCVKS